MWGRFLKISESLLALLSRLGCRQMPSPKNLRRVVVEVAKHEFMGKPLRVLYAMNSGVPMQHKDFWKYFLSMISLLYTKNL